MTLAKRHFAFALIGGLILSACTTVSPEARVRSKLIEAGMKPRVAGCMAERMVDRLSLVQLKKLQSLANLPRRAGGDIANHHAAAGIEKPPHLREHHGKVAFVMEGGEADQTIRRAVGSRSGRANALSPTTITLHA